MSYNSLSVKDLRDITKQIGGNITTNGKYKTKKELLNELNKSSLEVALDKEIKKITKAYGINRQIGGYNGKRKQLKRAIGQKNILNENMNYIYDVIQTDLVNRMRKGIADGLYKISIDLQQLVPDTAATLLNISNSLARNDFNTFEADNMLLRTQIPISLAMKLRKIGAGDKIPEYVNKIKDYGASIGKMQQKLPKEQQVSLKEHAMQLGLFK